MFARHSQIKPPTSQTKPLRQALTKTVFPKLTPLIPSALIPALKGRMGNIQEDQQKQSESHRREEEHLQRSRGVEGEGPSPARVYARRSTRGARNLVRTSGHRSQSRCKCGACVCLCHAAKSSRALPV